MARPKNRARWPQFVSPPDMPLAVLHVEPSGPPRLTRSYVWCDSHCSIHLPKPDYYDEGDDDCRRDNWRRVYVASHDASEEF